MLIGLLVAALTIAAVYATVLAIRPLVARAGGSPWLSSAGERGRAGLNWLTVRIAAEILILIAGSIVVVTLASIFGEILDEVVDDDDLTAIDRPAVAWLAARRTPRLNVVFAAVTDLGGALMLVAAVAVLAFVVARRLRSRRPVLLALVGLVGIQILVNVIKLVIGRDRPELPGRLVTVSGYSFPSGHAASSLVGFALLAWLTCMVTRNRTVWATAWLSATVGTTAVGLSRVYLGVHYPSDVLGGWMLGLTWLAVLAVATRVHDARASTGGPSR
ncbi:undecaprenyl-diphosphatase [Allocatelliglobosispora scoriae]|uniref:Undecaprenyl-diphosphatase n=1 Tax=Allocatelliglobosispora scoriae TaxID=643052 RepID=A0A841BM22_9ACTN|nr:phosphatase PAP2 family protein [Allocatelliglobosispora scoriae]MBB5868306.1 undecaprenyl-diphosphatase [Allocatelliglobosispora scoriae]